MYEVILDESMSMARMMYRLRSRIGYWWEPPIWYLQKAIQLSVISSKSSTMLNVFTGFLPLGTRIHNLYKQYIFQSYVESGEA